VRHTFVGFWTYARYYNDIRTYWSLDKVLHSLARFSAPESLIHTLSLANFITNTPLERWTIAVMSPIMVPNRASGRYFL
jgi:hypothetical protein